MNKDTVRPFVLTIVIIVLIVVIALILIKDSDNEKLENKGKTDIDNQEVIRVVSEDNSMMLDNISVKKFPFKKYLIFDVVRLDKNIKSVNFSISLLLDGDLVLKEDVAIESFGDNDSINKKIKLDKFNYDFENLSVNFEINEKNN